MCIRDSYNMVNMSRNWIGAGLIGLPQMLVALHLPVFLLALGILYWRQQQGLILSRPRKLTTAKVVQA
jgi:hypothetical protein